MYPYCYCLKDLTYEQKSELVFKEYIDECYGVAQGFTPEHLAATIDDKYYEVFEITINFPQEKMSLLQHLDCYRTIWEGLCKYYRPRNQTYFVEYCASKQAHIHGYMEIGYLPGFQDISDEIIMKEFARRIYLMLPKKYWKQYAKMEYRELIRRLKGPAVCLNLKNLLGQGWTNYIEKNA